MKVIKIYCFGKSIILGNVTSIDWQICLTFELGVAFEQDQLATQQLNGQSDQFNKHGVITMFNVSVYKFVNKGINTC
jgi:hypothetical protein